MTPRKLLLLPIALFAASGCTSTGSDGYPSLAIREIERAQGTFEPIETERIDVPQVAVDLTGGLDARLAALVGQAEEAHDGFLASLPAARRRVAAAAGSAIGSDAWATAQVALADLDSARSRAAIPLADLDVLLTAASVQAEDTAAIRDARGTVVTLVAQEDAILEELRARVR